MDMAAGELPTQVKHIKQCLCDVNRQLPDANFLFVHCSVLPFKQAFRAAVGGMPHYLKNI